MTAVSLSPSFSAPVSPPTDALGHIGVRMTFGPGEEIYVQDEDADMIHRVIRGAVRTTRLLSDGRRQIGDFYYADELIGLESGPVHGFSAEALGCCEIQVICKAVRRPLLSTVIQKHSPFRTRSRRS